MSSNVTQPMKKTKSFQNHLQPFLVNDKWMIINKQPEEVDAQGMVSSITPGYLTLFIRWLVGRWGLPLCSLHTSFYFCGGSVSKVGMGGSWETHQTVDLHLCSQFKHTKRVIEDARTFSISLSCHPHSVWIYFLVLNYHSPSLLALFWVFVSSCSHLYDRWIIPMATTVIMNPHRWAGRRKQLSREQRF